MPFLLSILLNVVVGVVLSVASTLIQQAFGSKSQQQTRGYRGTTQRGGTVPLSFLVGTIGVPGKQEDQNAWGVIDGTPNAYLVDIISFGDLPVDGFEGLFVNGAEVTVQGTGHVAQGYPVTEYADHLWVEFFDGSQTTANAYLTSKFGSDADRPWQSDMIGRWVPYLTLTARIGETLWSRFPTYMAVFRGIRLYDPREDDEAGGEGGQRWDDQDTWAFSDNPLVIAYNILRGIHTPDGEHFWGGDAEAAQLPYDSWAAAMDACDELVDLDGGGSEKRYRAGREISVNEMPSDVLNDLLSGAGARLALCQGRYYPLVGIPDAVDGSFTDADVVITDGTTLDAFPNLDAVVNGATATYLEPAQAWERKETAPYYRSDLQEADDGRRQLRGVALDTVFSGTQAQRVLKLMVEEGRRFRRHVVPLHPAFGAYRVLQVLSWVSAANGYEAKRFLITARTEGPDGSIVFGLQEIDPADGSWTPATDEQPLSFAPSTPVRPPPQPMVGWAIEPFTALDEDGNPRRAGIRVVFTGGLEDVRAVEVQIRVFNTPDTIVDAEVPYDITIAEPSAVWAGDPILPATKYEARGRFVPFSGRETEWSAWLAVTTADIAIALPDLDPELRAQLQWAREQVPADLFAVREELDSLATSLNGQVTMLREMAGRINIGVGERYEENRASAELALTAAASATESVAALAGQVTVIYENLSADGKFVVLSAANPDGAVSAIELTVNAGTVEEPDLASAAIMLAAYYDGDDAYSTMRLVGDRIVFTDDAGEPAATFDGTYIKELTVGTITLQQGAVVAAAAVGPATQTWSGISIPEGDADDTGWTTIATRDVVVDEFTEFVDLALLITRYGWTWNSGHTPQVELSARLRRNGTVLLVASSFVDISSIQILSTAAAIGWSWIDFPSSEGTYTYDWQVIADIFNNDTGTLTGSVFIGPVNARYMAPKNEI